ncbi:MAG: hypothetical protein A2Z88_03410 [Omnitrophica WOR_2 bacterium GWA2_47_8]|nr:MAG: hypothetical protein A2Z88_03410 [Omnitrophica WOR_2 bacterium GWA2_47_8]
MSKINLSEYRGDDIDYVFEFINGNGDPIDITGWVLFFTLKKSVNDDDSAALLKIDVASHSDPVNGKSKITIPKESSDDLAGDYVYDFQYKDSSGRVKTIMSGEIEFIKDVTIRTVPV